MEKEKKLFYKKWWFWLLIAFLLFTLTSTIVGQSSKTEEKDIFLKGTNGKEFYKILCSVGEIEEVEPQEMGETILYESSNSNFSVEVEANSTTNEIAYVRMMVFQTNEYENFFNSISRLEYSQIEKSEIINWIHDNLGKETSTKIGNVNFILTNGNNNKPILEIKTDDYDEYQKEQINKLINQ